MPNATDLFKHLLFAYDSTISCEIPNSQLTCIQQDINNHLLLINEWLSANRMLINEDKTKYMIFSNRNILTLPLISIANNTIHPTVSTKFLGIIIDCNLSFKFHIEYLASKLSKSLGVMNKVKDFLPKKVMITLYNSLIKPYIGYGIEAYFNSSKSNLSKIEVIQKKCIRVINNLDFNSHTNDYFLSDKILKLNDLHIYQVMLYIFKTIHINNHDPLLLQSLYPHSLIHNHVTRHRHQLVLPRCHYSKSQNTITYIGIKYWNCLPQAIKISKSLFEFKCKLKAHLFSQYC